MAKRKEVNFERYHKLHSKEVVTIKSILHDSHKMPYSIADLIIDLMVSPYFKSFCRIDLSFDSNEENIFAIAKIPKVTKRFGFDSLSMGGNVNNLTVLESFRRGSGYGADWGRNFQRHCGPWKLHSYNDLNISTDKEVKELISFDIWMQSFRSDEWMFKSNRVGQDYPESDHPYLVQSYGGFKVLCIDYSSPKSLEFAEKYAQKFRKEGQSIIVFVVTSSGNTNQNVKENMQYLSWDDCMMLANKYDASLFEMSSNADNSCLFVYNQILIEYIDALCK